MEFPGSPNSEILRLRIPGVSHTLVIPPLTVPPLTVPPFVVSTLWTDLVIGRRGAPAPARLMAPFCDKTNPKALYMHKIHYYL